MVNGFRLKAGEYLGRVLAAPVEDPPLTDFHGGVVRVTLLVDVEGLSSTEVPFSGITRPFILLRVFLRRASIRLGLLATCDRRVEDKVLEDEASSAEEDCDLSVMVCLGVPPAFEDDAVTASLPLEVISSRLCERDAPNGGLFFRALAADDAAATLDLPSVLDTRVTACLPPVRSAWE